MHLARSNARELNDQKTKQMHHRGARNHQKQATHLLDFSEQHTIRHELDACGRCNVPLVANLVGHFSENKSCSCIYQLSYYPSRKSGRKSSESGKTLL